MAKQRGNFFGLMTVALMLGSMMRWGKRTRDTDHNQGYGSPIYNTKRKKLKGYQKTTGRKKGFHKFKQH